MRSEIFNKVKNYRQIQLISRQLGIERKKIVFVVGCFDVLHLGHIIFFEQARKFGDILVVGIGDDKTIKQLKGKDRPIYPEVVRAGQIAATSLADYVVILTEPLRPNKNNFSLLISKIKPDFFVVNDDDSDINDKRLAIEQNGGQIILVSRRRPSNVPFVSTTRTYAKIKKLFD